MIMEAIIVKTSWHYYTMKINKTFRKKKLTISNNENNNYNNKNHLKNGQNHRLEKK